ncbi:MAG: pyridoxine 5'-phosphate synthase, partial [Bacteroidota bacterium]
MTKLSVNVNKIATLRNARGGNVPDLLKVVRDMEGFGAEGITVHPRPDERHITYQDTRDLKKMVHTEFNIEGNPIKKFIDLVLEVNPTQVTLVPDAADAITSNAGWDTVSHKGFLKDVIQIFKDKGIRTSIFVDTNPKMIEGAALTG